MRREGQGISREGEKVYQFYKEQSMQVKGLECCEVDCNLNVC